MVCDGLVSLGVPCFLLGWFLLGLAVCFNPVSVRLLCGRLCRAGFFSFEFVLLGVWL